MPRPPRTRQVPVAVVGIGALTPGASDSDATPATRLWYGKVRNEPGYRSVSHHHGEAETGGYVLSGRARIHFGEKFEDYIDSNLSRTRPLVWMTTRTPENIVVNLPDVADAELRDWLDRR